MKTLQPPTAEECAAHYGLKVERVSELPDDISGFLDDDPEPRFIAVNANHPPEEQTFAISQAIADRIYPDGHPKVLRFQQFLNRLSQKNPLIAEAIATAMPICEPMLSQERVADNYGVILCIVRGDIRTLIHRLKEHHDDIPWAVFLFVGRFCQVFFRSTRDYIHFCLFWGIVL